MADITLKHPPEGVTSTRSLPFLVLLFAGSGAAALIYEIVWFQLLELVIGSSAVSLAVLLATFMGGMCIGSLWLPRLVSAGRHPLQVYALLEFGIGIIGVLVLFLMPYVGGLYTAAGGFGGWGIVARALACAVCLFPPTMLMGATLPAIARWVESTPRGISWLGLFYGGNIAGAVAGCLIAGFYLLRVYDMYTATYVAAAINAVAGSFALLLAGKTFHLPHATAGSHSLAGERQSPLSSPSPWAVRFAIALSGACALGAEVVWTRVLSLLLGASVYSFSIILAVFLLGMGIGSAAGSVLAARSRDPRRALGICQMLAAAAIAWAAFMLTRVLPFWPIDPAMARSPWLNFSLDLLCGASAILPAACFWGASFPLALAAVAVRSQDAGRLVGSIYAWNTLGAIVGAAGFSVVLTHTLGTQMAQQVLIGAAGTAALLLLIIPLRPPGKAFLRPGRALFAVAAALVAVVAAASIQPVPSSLIGYGSATARTLSLRDPVTGEFFVPNFLYVGEGMNASIAVSQTSTGYRNFHVSGKIEASTEPQDMRLQRMLGHLPGLLHPRPLSVLIVGFGSGVTAGSFVNHPSVERIVICEIEPLIPEVVAKYFAAENENILEDPRVEVIYDDARHYLLTTNEKFDVITSDPIHPWVKGAATLYTSEYINLVRTHLKPGGVVSQWVPLYQSSMDVVKSELATFFEVFQDGTVWSNNLGGSGYDIVLLGRESSTAINVDAFEQRLNRRDHANAVRSLREVGFNSATDLLATYLANAADLVVWLNGVEINRDRNLRLQYTAGLSLHMDEATPIFDAMAGHRRLTAEVFVGSQPQLDELMSAINRRQPRVLNSSQAAIISKALAAVPPHRISIGSVLGNAEALRYAIQIRGAVAAGGWEVDGVSQSLFSDVVVGMLISVGSEPPPPHANELFRALQAAGLTVAGHLNRNAGSDSILLFVGDKQ